MIESTIRSLYMSDSQQELENYIQENKQEFIENFEKYLELASKLSEEIIRIFLIISRSFMNPYQCKYIKLLKNSRVELETIYDFFDNCLKNGNLENIVNLFTSPRLEAIEKLIKKYKEKFSQVWKIMLNKNMFSTTTLRILIKRFIKDPKTYSSFFKYATFSGEQIFDFIGAISNEKIMDFVFSRYDGTKIERVLQILIYYNSKKQFMTFIKNRDLSNVKPEIILKKTDNELLPFYIEKLFEYGVKFNEDSIKTLIENYNFRAAKIIIEKTGIMPTELNLPIHQLNPEDIKFLYDHGFKFNNEHLNSALSINKKSIVLFFISIGLIPSKKYFIIYSDDRITDLLFDKFKFDSEDLRKAAVIHNIPLVIKMLKIGIEPKQDDKSDFQNLYSNIEIVKLLYKNKLQFNALDDLVFAAQNNYLKTVEFFLNIGIIPKNITENSKYLSSLKMTKLMSNYIKFTSNDLDEIEDLDIIMFLIENGVKLKTSKFSDVINRIMLVASKSTIENISDETIKNYVKKEFDKGNYNTVLKLTKEGKIPKHLITLDKITKNIIKSAPTSLYNQNFDFERNMYWYDPKHPRFQGDQKPSFNVFNYWIHDTNDEENLKKLLTIDKEACFSKIHNDDYLLYKNYGIGLVFKGVAPVAFIQDAGSYVKNGYRFQGDEIYGERTEAWAVPIDLIPVGLVGNNIKQLNKLSKNLNIPIYSDLRILTEKNPLYIDSLGIRNIQTTINTLNQFIYKYKLIINKYSPEKFHNFYNIIKHDIKNNKILEKYVEESGFWTYASKQNLKEILQNLTNYFSRIVAKFKSVENEYHYQ